MLIDMPRLSTKLVQSANHVLRLLLPPSCVFCHAAVDADARICPTCATTVRPLSPHRCRRCGQPLPEDLVPGPCGRCLKRPPPQQETQALYAYQGPVRQAILAWKLEGMDAGLLWLLDAATPRIRQLFAADDLLLPVPMPLKRMRRRGQHHAAELCRRLSQISGAQWRWNLLTRLGEQPRQSTLSGRARRQNLRHAFAVDTTHRLPPCKRLWIIDDISTTGSTLYYAARAAKSLGKPVLAFSLARVQDTYES